jgi:hypothetical protein
VSAGDGEVRSEGVQTCTSRRNRRGSNDSDVRNQTNPCSESSYNHPTHCHSRDLHAYGEVVIHRVVLLQLLLCAALLVSVAHDFRLDDLASDNEREE